MSCIPGPRDDLSCDVFKPIRVILQGFDDAEWAFPIWCKLAFRVVIPCISSKPPNQVVGLEAKFLELRVLFLSYSSFTGFF